MIDVAALIADLVVAGTPAALVGRVASALATPSRDEELSADRRERDRIRKRNYREKSIVASAERPRNVPRTERDTTPPLSPPPKEIPQTPLEITPYPKPTPPQSKRGTRLSANWVLPKPYGDWALAQGLPRDRIVLEAEKMRDWAINAPDRIGAKRDWFAAWRNWVKKAIDELPRQRGSPSRPLTGLAALTENFKQELQNDGYGRQGEESGDPVDDARFPLLTGPHH
jgi:hypothetical protein